MSALRDRLGLLWGRYYSAALATIADARLRRVPLAALPHENVDDSPLADRAVVDLVTVAYENAQVIDWQLQLLRKHLRDPHHHITVDNSPSEEGRRAIAEVCRRHGSGYVALAQHTAAVGKGSDSHGLALNWALRRLVAPRGATAFGFIDHDLFPIRSTSLLEPLAAVGVYGVLQGDASRWYLWPGFSCFTAERVAGTRLDFRPALHSDTGARNWKRLYARVPFDRGAFAAHAYGKLREGDDPQADWYETMGDWLHTFNASGWKDVDDRDDLVAELVTRYL
jgi:hypothetical protein